MKKRNKLFRVCITTLIAVLCMSTMPVMADDDDDNIRPERVTISKSQVSVYQGKEFKLKAKVTPKDADDDDLRWEIVSGKKYIKFDDDDRDDDEVEMKAVKVGTAKVRCYIKGKDKPKYGDVVTLKVLKKKANYSLSRAGSKVRTIEKGDDFELKVNKGHSIKDSQLKWTIANKNIVGFDDDDRTDNEVEFKAKAVETTTVTCTCTNKNAKVKKITFTIKVVPDADDDDDDNDDDDDDQDDD